MQYSDVNGVEIKAGMLIRLADGSVERVYSTTDAFGNPDLGINATNEKFLHNHPDAEREYYPLSACSPQKCTVVRNRTIL